MSKQITEFRLINSLGNRDEDQFIAKFDLVETPGIGEVVNINGEPYVVYSKGWGFSDECQVEYCYICLVTASAHRRLK
ncbi:MAG TPA: hypothetical protein ENI67_04845 [Gammaproteobacteria bacterium]|nr:hypothetical protein [Gammaproteobacteria bacterium]